MPQVQPGGERRGGKRTEPPQKRPAGSSFLGKGSYILDEKCPIITLSDGTKLRDMLK